MESRYISVKSLIDNHIMTSQEIRNACISGGITPYDPEGFRLVDISFCTRGKKYKSVDECIQLVRHMISVSEMHRNEYFADGKYDVLFARDEDLILEFAKIFYEIGNEEFIPNDQSLRDSKAYSFNFSNLIGEGSEFDPIVNDKLFKKILFLKQDIDMYLKRNSPEICNTLVDTQSQCKGWGLVEKVLAMEREGMSREEMAYALHRMKSHGFEGVSDAIIGALLHPKGDIKGLAQYGKDLRLRGAANTATTPEGKNTTPNE